MSFRPQQPYPTRAQPDVELSPSTSSQSSDLENEALQHLEEVDDDGNSAASLPDQSNERPMPPHLKEISSLASWVVSSCKPGCGVDALRDPSPARFWQSDGPQPHNLTIHFFKRVRISYMRLYIDFTLDESYTPTKIELWAGTAHFDLIWVCTMTPREPKGWIDVDMSDVGGPCSIKPSEVIEDSSDEDFDAAGLNNDQNLASARTARAEASAERRRWRRIGTGDTLCCFVMQFRIIENHQNGKDTHLRGVEIYARDESYVFGRRKRTVHTNRRAMGSSEAVDTKHETRPAADDRHVENWDKHPPGFPVANVPIPATMARATSEAAFMARDFSASTEPGTEVNVTGARNAPSTRKKKKEPRRSQAREDEWMDELEMRLNGRELR